MRKQKRILCALLLLSMLVGMLQMLDINAAASGYYGITYTLSESEATAVTVDATILDFFGNDSTVHPYTCFFTPSSSGWYTFAAKNQSGDGVFYLCSDKLGECGDYFYLSESGGHYYLQGGVKYDFTLECAGLFSDTWTTDIYVQKSDFHQLSEDTETAFPVNELFNGLYFSYVGDACTEYMKFVPSKTGFYSFDFSPCGWYSYGVGILDAYGNDIEKDIEHELSGEWTLTAELAANNTYYLWNWQDMGTCTVLAHFESSAGGDGKEPCKNHSYTSAGGNFCTVCGFEFVPELIACEKTMYVSEEIVAVRDQPYAKAGTRVDTLEKDTAVRVTHFLYNALGSKWYLTQSGKYVYSGNLTDEVPALITLTYYSGNSDKFTNIPATQINSTGIFRVAKAIPERKGFIFLGWSTSKNAEDASIQPGSNLCTGTDLTLYPVWKQKPVTYSEDIEELLTGIINGENDYSRLGDGGDKYWQAVVGNSSTQSWCAAYITWLLEQVGVSLNSDIACINTYPPSQMKCFKENECFHSAASGYTPKTGDLAFFSWDGDNYADHVAIVMIDETGTVAYLHGNYHSTPVSEGKLKHTIVCYSGGCTYDSSDHSSYLNSHLIGYGDMQTYLENYST